MYKDHEEPVSLLENIEKLMEFTRNNKTISGNRKEIDKCLNNNYGRYRNIKQVIIFHILRRKVLS